MTLLVFRSWTPYVIPLILPVYFIFFKKIATNMFSSLVLIGWYTLSVDGVPQG